MPTYVITAPDGNEYEIDAPEGATEQDVLAYAQQNYQSAKPGAAPKKAVEPSRPAATPKSKAWDYNPTSIKALDPFTRQAGAFVDGVQHRALDALHGLGQLGTQGLQAAMPNGSEAERYFQGVNASDGAVLAERERAYQERTGTTAGSYVGAAAGNVLPWLVGVGELRAAGMLPQLARTRDVAGVVGKTGNLAAKGGLLAAEGAVVGATRPVLGDQPFWQEKGRATAQDAIFAPVAGAAGAGLIRGAQGLRQGARYLTPGGRDAIANQRLAGLVGNEPNILDTLSRVPQYVPGEQPTLAQAVATPQALQVERALRNNPHAGVAFVEQETANNAARMNLLRTLAGTDEQLKAAKETRAANSDGFRTPYLPENGSPLVDPAPLLAVLERKATDANPSVRQAAAEQLRLIRTHMKANGGKVPAYELDALQQEAGSTLRQFSSNGVVGTKEEARYAPVKNSFVDTLDGAIPGYRDYLATYARDSAPINDMGAARRLVADSSLAGLDGSGGQTLSLPQLRKTLRLDEREAYPMTDGAREQFENILRSLQRRSISDNKIAASGPGTAAEVGATFMDSPLMRVLGAGGAATAGTAALGPVGGIVGLLMAEGAQAARRDITRRVGQKAASAPKAKAALEAAQRQRQKALTSGVPQYLLPWNPR